MAINKPHIFEQGVYFITFTNYKWLSLFSAASAYDVVYNWFDALKRKGHYVTGYVIMPNHVHALIAYSKSPQSLNTIVGNGKRFMAYDIADKLKDAGRTDILALLKAGVNVADKKKGKLHEVFEPAFDAKICHDFKFFNQKLEYIHANPVSKKWMLAPDTISYMHSSARFYETGAHSYYPVIHYMESLSSEKIAKSSYPHRSSGVISAFF